MPYINQKLFFSEIEKGLQRSEFKALARREAQEKLKEYVDDLILNFDRHPVTRELDQADPERGGNISRTISTPEGNLFSFIGFNSGSKPTNAIRQVFRSRTFIKGDMRRGRITRESTRTINFEFDVEIPGFDDVYDETPFPGPGGGWQPGSWVEGIEATGISGIANYLFLRRKTFAKSRSGPAVQKKKVVSSFRGFRKQKYVREMLKKFAKQFR